MCDACVMNAVKEKMLSRRSLFKAGAAGVAATALGSGMTGTPALAAGHGSVLDMTHELHAGFPTYFGEPGFAARQVFNWDEHKFNLLELTVNEHTGTHIDAPLHFSPDGQSVAEIPVENLVAPLCVIDIRARAAQDTDAQVTPDDIKAWMDAHGEIPAGACVAMNSGWSAKTATDAYRGTDDAGKQHYPGFHVEAAQMLMEGTGAMSIASDTLSLDHGISADFATHYAWLPSGRFGIENLANLDAVPAAGATLVIGAPKHRGGTGGPARIFAMV
ncbi:cyclase family protein [Sulfitobacter sp. S190]|uniref:cyclase family protein n=1 Tax=Sulfitobacter sp. S190 TaxID=2867022 RepID=UPI0021A8702C|nr:cyclase family protein [Sulfitobacter sp. S190]UWR21786.1 cyclase family protein [Sulfitobacter sp. S190]